MAIQHQNQEREKQPWPTYEGHAEKNPTFSSVTITKICGIVKIFSSLMCPILLTLSTVTLEALVVIAVVKMSSCRFESHSLVFLQLILYHFLMRQ